MRLCSDCDENYIWFFSFIFEFLSKFLHVLCCRILLWPSDLLQLQEGALCLIVGSAPLMSSLSDKNMRLGDVLLPPGIKQRCLYPRVQGLFTLRNVLLMQLPVALSLHFGWDSQLNASEMFWIDISRWMIHSRCRGISVYLSWRTDHAFQTLSFFAA